MGFKLYKGIKKPLVLFGLKDKYIYYALGVMLLGMITAGGLNTFFGIYATLLGATIAIGGIWVILYIQDNKGLYTKKKTKNEVLIIPKRIRKKTRAKNEKTSV